MSLKAQLDSLDGVPEALHEHYTEKDGKFFLAAEGVEDVRGLKSALAKERKSREDLEKKARTFEGINPEEFKRLQDLEQKQKEGNLTDKQKEELESIKAQMGEEHEKIVTSKDDTITKLFGKVSELMIDNEARRVIGETGNAELLLPHVRQQAKVIEENGDYVVQILDAKGLPRVKGVHGDPFEMEDLITHMKDQDTYAGAFAGSGSSGSGSSGGGSHKGGGGTGTIVLKGADAKDPAKYRAAKKQAEKEGRELVLET